jgi:Xaa-Pro aminopeptidase
MDLKPSLGLGLEHPYERNREGFTAEDLRQAQKRSWEGLRALRKMIRPGMLEDEAREEGLKLLRKMGFPKQWHRLYVRFGKNTLLKFGEPSAPETRLGENDIYYLDIGPVWNAPNGMQYEGDVGDTFVVGDDPEMHACADACRELFHTVAGIWKREDLSGEELYRRATEEADKLGYPLHQNVDGHRAGDFPHQIFFKGGISDLDFKPRGEGVWILEIQIRHPTREFGAFYEDSLE